MSAVVKCEFAELKYEQLLGEKYLVKTCFSKKYDSYPPKQKLRDLLMRIRFEEKDCI